MKKLLNRFDLGQIITILMTIIILGGILTVIIIRPINKVTNRRKITATVTDKNVKNVGDSDKYIIYTTDEYGDIQVFEITDALFAWRFDSSDVYAGIEIGKTYTFEVGGSRVPFFSWYPNIYKYTESEGK